MKCNLIKLSQWKVTIFTCNLNIKIMNSMTFFRAVSQQTEFTKSKCLETNLHQNAVMKWSALWFIFTDAVSAKGLVCRIWGQKWNIIGLHLCVVSLETKRSEPFFFFFFTYVEGAGHISPCFYSRPEWTNQTLVPGRAFYGCIFNWEGETRGVISLDWWFSFWSSEVGFSLCSTLVFSSQVVERGAHQAVELQVLQLSATSTQKVSRSVTELNQPQQ